MSIVLVLRDVPEKAPSVFYRILELSEIFQKCLYEIKFGQNIFEVYYKRVPYWHRETFITKLIHICSESN